MLEESRPTVVSLVPSDVKVPGARRDTSGVWSRRSSWPVSVAINRTTPGVESPSARVLLSAEKAKYRLLTDLTGKGISFHVPTSHNRGPPPVVTSHLPSALNPTTHHPPTGKSITCLPVPLSQTLAPAVLCS